MAPQLKIKFIAKCNIIFPVSVNERKEKIKNEKNLWRRKCVRRGIFRTVEVKVEGDEAPFNPYFVCNTSNCVTVRPDRGHLTLRINIAFFIRNLMLNIFFSTVFSKKSCIVRENSKKLFWGCI